MQNDFCSLSCVTIEEKYLDIYCTIILYVTSFIFANLIAFYSFPSVFFFQNMKLDFAMTLKKQKFAKISTRKIFKVEKFAKISSREN